MKSTSGTDSGKTVVASPHEVIVTVMVRTVILVRVVNYRHQHWRSDQNKVKVEVMGQGRWRLSYAETWDASWVKNADWNPRWRKVSVTLVCVLSERKRSCEVVTLWGTLVGFTCS